MEDYLLHSTANKQHDRNPFPFFARATPLVAAGERIMPGAAFPSSFQLSSVVCTSIQGEPPLWAEGAEGRKGLVATREGQGRAGRRAETPSLVKKGILTPALSLAPRSRRLLSSPFSRKASGPPYVVACRNGENMDTDRLFCGQVW